MAANLSDLQWMCGPWTGSLGPQSVMEHWSQPSGGTMSTMVRLTSPTETLLVELIVIRQSGDSLILHLRQFSADLQLVLEQDMPLHSLTHDRVEFTATPDSSIKSLAYRSLGDNQMEVDVTTADGTVLTAGLQR